MDDTAVCTLMKLLSKLSAQWRLQRAKGLPLDVNVQLIAALSDVLGWHRQHRRHLRSGRTPKSPPVS